MSELPPSSPPSAEAASARSLVLLRVSGTWLAIDAMYAERVAERGTVTALPRAPNHIPGLTLVKARAVPVLDLVAFLGLSEPESTEDESELSRQRQVIVRASGLAAAIPCDQVRIMREIPDAEIHEVAASQQDALPKFATATLTLDDEIAIVIDLSKTLEAARVRRH